MKIILVANDESSIYRSLNLKKINILNTKDYNLFKDEIFELEDSFFLVLIDNYSGIATRDKIERIQQLQDSLQRNNSKLYVMTKDLILYSYITNRKNDNFKVAYHPIAITSSFISDVFKGVKANNAMLADNKTEVIQSISEPSSREETKPNKDKSFFARFKNKSKKDQSAEDLSELKAFGKGISRTIAVTGHRGSGITSTTVNIANALCKRGVNTLIIDMDIQFRSLNMYVNEFNEKTKEDDVINSSLIRTLAKPSEYMTTCFNIKENLWMTSLGYGFEDRLLMEKFYTPEKFVGMLTLLKSKFNVVLVDMPLDVMKIFKESKIHMDLFALCVENNTYSILNTIRHIETTMTTEEAVYFNSKAKLLINKYNQHNKFDGEFLTPDIVSEIMASGISDKLVYQMVIAGSIPYNEDFETQIEKDMPLVLQSKKVELEYNEIILRLLEGA